MKLVAIKSGSCYDCSCDHLVIPDGMNLSKEYEEWNRWYREVYCPGLQEFPRVAYVSFVDRLKEKGAVDPTSDQIEIFED